MGENILVIFLLEAVKITGNMQNTKMKEEMRPQDLSNRNDNFKTPTFHVSDLPYSNLGSSDFQVQRHIHIY